VAIGVGGILLASLTGAMLLEKRSPLAAEDLSGIGPVAASSPTAAGVQESLGKLPLHFEMNRGQTAPAVKYLARGSGYTVFLTPGEAVLRLQQPVPRRRAGVNDTARAEARKAETVRIRFVGSRPSPRIVGEAELPGKANYFIGADSRRWRAGIPLYQRVRYREVYPGIDVVYYGNQRQVEYDLIVKPGADPRAIRLAFDGVKSLRLDRGGDLVLRLAAGEVRQRKPRVYQEVDGGVREIAGGYVLRSPSARTVGFQVTGYDPSRPLIIDPVLTYS
jgi:hypothetical protein